MEKLVLFLVGVALVIIGSIIDQSYKDERRKSPFTADKRGQPYPKNSHLGWTLIVIGCGLWALPLFL